MGMAWCNQETQSPLEVPKDMLRMGVAWCDQIFQILGDQVDCRIHHCSGGGWCPRECYEWVWPGAQGFSESNKEDWENLLL